MKRYGGIVSFRVTGGEQQALDVCDDGEGVHAGGVARRRRVADRAPGPDDARLGGRHRAGGAGRPDPAQSVGIETVDDLLADLDQRPRTLAEPGRVTVVACVDFGSTFTKAALVDAARATCSRRAEPPHHDRHRRARRLGRLPRRAGRRRPAGRGRRGAGLLARPAAACGSRWSATRSWSPPRPAAGSRCPAAAGSCTWPAAA